MCSIIFITGITNRIDVMELLEKRVKSRFSHRHIFLFPNEVDQNCASPIQSCKDVLVQCLSLPIPVKKDKKKKRKSTGEFVSNMAG